MSEPTFNPDPLDARLKEHISNVLDPQLGRAEARFLQQLQSEAAGAARPRSSYRWAAGLVGTALAASIAVISVMPLLDRWRSRDSDGVQVGANDQPKPVIPVEQLVNYRTIDGGTVVLGDGVPARVVRQQRVHQVRWFDPESGAQMEMIVPHEDVRFMELDTY